MFENYNNRILCSITSRWTSRSGQVTTAWWVTITACSSAIATPPFSWRATTTSSRPVVPLWGLQSLETIMSCSALVAATLPWIWLGITMWWRVTTAESRSGMWRVWTISYRVGNKTGQGTGRGSGTSQGGTDQNFRFIPAYSGYQVHIMKSPCESIERKCLPTEDQFDQAGQEDTLLKSIINQSLELSNSQKVYLYYLRQWAGWWWTVSISECQTWAELEYHLRNQHSTAKM